MVNTDKTVIFLVGSGLSASSGIPTFRGSGGLWAGYDATDLATLDAFQTDPSLVWQFYSMRRSLSLKAKPNKGHYALAELSKRMGNKFLALTQNVDGLSARAGHPSESLLHLHGDLFSLKCTSFMCTFKQENNFQNPLTRELGLCTSSDDFNKPQVKNISIEDLPRCPRCKGLLRPGVVWYGETLPLSVIDTADKFVVSNQVDLIIIIGTSGVAWPAASYIEQVIMRGGKVALFDIERPDPREFPSDGWVFIGDAAEVLPKVLEPIIGSGYMPGFNF